MVDPHPQPGGGEPLSDGSREPARLALLETIFGVGAVDGSSARDVVAYLADHGTVDGDRPPLLAFGSPRYAAPREGDAPDDRARLYRYLFEEIGEDRLRQSFEGCDADAVRRLRARFDPDHYIGANPDVARLGVDAFLHYMTQGWTEGRDPSSTFSTGGYLDRYPDVAATGVNPFLHWVMCGIAEGREGGPVPAETGDPLASLSAARVALAVKAFDAGRYAQVSGADHADPVIALNDYLTQDGTTRHEPTASFDAARYLDTHPDARGDIDDPFLHYLFATVGEAALQEALGELPIDLVEDIRAAFDAAWYLYRYPEKEAAGVDAFVDYMTTGWRAHRDPTPDFSTKAYIKRYPDIDRAKVNPFLHWLSHGRTEGRSGVPALQRFRGRPYRPPVTAIVVIDHDGAIAPTIRALSHQTYGALDAVVVDRRGIADGGALAGAMTAAGVPIIVVHAAAGERALVDDWRDGIAAATGDLVWLCRSAIDHSPDYLERIVSSFADGSVQLGFGRIVPRSAGPAGRAPPSSVPRNWDIHMVSLAAHWFAREASLAALTGDPGDAVWRRTALPEAIWREAANYRSIGHWRLYLQMVAGGQFAWVRDAVARMAVAGHATPDDLAGDVGRLMDAVQRRWGDAGPAARGLKRDLGARRRDRGEAGRFDPAVPPPKIPRQSRQTLHVLLVVHGIFPGGAENFPIQLANSLVARGCVVSMLIFKTDDINEFMRRSMDPAVSLFEADWVSEFGCNRFVREAGISVIHSHGIVGERQFFGRWRLAADVPYVVTLHGSYEASTPAELPERMLATIARRVDHFVYTADKNLTPLAPYAIAPSRISKMSNAMPVDPVPFPLTRAQMGIADDAIVFAFVARGIREKGWEAAIKALLAVQAQHPDRPLHLCLVGEGEETDRLRKRFGGHPAITFLGYQSRIHGLYRLSDVALVPSRFSGESYPLCIIQALQVGTPVVATDVGQIGEMLAGGDGAPGGLLVRPLRDNRDFVARLGEAMAAMIDDDARHRFAAGAQALGERYDMDCLVGDYIDLYETVVARRRE